MAYLIYRYKVQRYRTKCVVMLRKGLSISPLSTPEGGWQCSEIVTASRRPSGLFYLILGGNCFEIRSGFSYEMLGAYAPKYSVNLRF